MLGGGHSGGLPQRLPPGHGRALRLCATAHRPAQHWSQSFSSQEPPGCVLLTRPQRPATGVSAFESRIALAQSEAAACILGAALNARTFAPQHLSRKAVSGGAGPFCPPRTACAATVLRGGLPVGHLQAEAGCLSQLILEPETPEHLCCLTKPWFILANVLSFLFRP